jgi:hypothetical protein
LLLSNLAHLVLDLKLLAVHEPVVLDFAKGTLDYWLPSLYQKEKVSLDDLSADVKATSPVAIHSTPVVRSDPALPFNDAFIVHLIAGKHETKAQKIERLSTLLSGIRHGVRPQSVATPLKSLSQGLRACVKP